MPLIQFLSHLKHYTSLHSLFQKGTKHVKEKQEQLSLKGICPQRKQGKLMTLFQFDKRGPPPEWVERIAKSNKRKATL